MTARLGNQERYADEQRSGNLDRARNGEIERVRRIRRRRDATFEIDCVIVSRVSADGRASGVLRQMNMQVSGRGCGMIRFLNVNVQEGCLKEAPEKGGNAQNCGGLLHRFQSITNLNFSVSPGRSRSRQMRSASKI